MCVQRYPVVMSTYLGIMGRVLLQNASFFSSLLTQMASECNQKVGLDGPVNVCIKKFIGFLN